jgi:hypothetical protein
LGYGDAGTTPGRTWRGSTRRWTALRFVVDNTGAWAFHCHIEPQLHMGMSAIFIEGVDKMRELNVPREAMMRGVIRTSAAVLTCGPSLLFKVRISPARDHCAKLV